MKIKLNHFALFLGATLLGLPDVVNAQFSFTTNNGAITITSGYGASGAIVLPSTINGLPVTSIGVNAFQNCYDLTSVTVPSSVTNLGQYAFAYCYRLTGMYFQGNAPAGGYAFAGDNVTVYYLPGTSGWSSQYGGRPAVMLNPPNPAGSLQVTLSPTAAISYGMRWQVDGGVEQPSGAIVSGLSVGNHTVSFSSANGWLIPVSQTVTVNADSVATASGTYGQLSYTTNSGTITITWCTGSDAVVVLPGTINGLPVTSIGSAAFQNCTSLTNITIPASVTNIGLYAFSYCYRLTGVYFQGNAPSLGFGAYVFDSIATIYYLPGTSGWSSLYGGRPAVMLNPPNPAGSLKVTISPTAAITNGMQWQVDGGLAQPSGAIVSGLSVGNHIVSFSPVNGWAMLASQSVAVSANSTTTVNVTAGQLSYTTNNGTITITWCYAPGGAIILPGTINGLPVTSIGASAFQNCYNLTSVTIPSSVTNIGPNAFSYCYRMTEMYFQGNAPSLGSGAFAGVNATVYYLPGTSGWSSYFGGRPAVMLNPPNPAGSLKVTLSPAAAITAGAKWQVDGGLAQPSGAIVSGLSVGNHTVSFSPVNGWAMLASQTVAVSANSTATVSVTYGQFTYTTNNGVITITKYSHNGSGVVIPGTINGLTVARIAANAFLDCSSLTSVTIPSSVTNIGVAPFAGCTSLGAITVDPANSFYSSTNGILFNKNQTTLIQFPGGVGGSYTIPQSVTSIWTRAFSGSSLTNITINTNLTSIGQEAFEESGLTSITIPNSVTNIGIGAFQECGLLTSVTIPTSVTSIELFAFAQCYGLTGIYFQGNAPSLGSDVFTYDNYAVVYYLPWTTGWGTPDTSFGGRPTALWLPQAQTGDANFGVVSNQFGFNITWASDQVVVVDACTDLADPTWTPVGTNTLTGGSSYFRDSQWTNYPDRFYRLRSPWGP